MKYEKPEIIALGSAVSTVQNRLSKGDPNRDCAEVPSTTACEADE
jgi:hypothetical protein